MEANAHRYVSGNWNHIFDGCLGERDLRFVFDREANQVVAMQILTGRGYKDATHIEAADVTDSLVNANSEVLDNPEDHDLESSDDLPEWVALEHS